ncbi:MAG: DUF2997 domain-containing protein [Deltaproteobacteria bacterium]|nr:DUF2997 domain-containing protein [Deltaproteobacteria bacterium]
MKYEIDIEIREDGTVGFGVKGARGRRCKEITKALEEALGEVRTVEHTAEYYQEEEEVREEDRVEVDR